MDRSAYSADLQEILRRAQAMARHGRSEFVLPEHVFFTVANLDESLVPAILDHLKVSPNKIKSLMEEELKFVLPTSTVSEAPDPTPKVEKLLEAATFWARELADGDEEAEAGPEHVLLACVSDESPIGKNILAEIGLTSRLVRRAISEVRALGVAPGLSAGAGPDAVRPQAGGGAALAAGGAQALLNFCTDLTALARDGKLAPVIGRADEVNEVIRTLSCMKKSNPLIIGEPGVGKTALVEGLAQRIVDGEVPEFLRDKTVLGLDVGALIAGASYRGEFEERLKNVIEGVRQSQGGILLFIDELHVLMGAGGQKGGADAANLLKPVLARGEVQIIGATTRDEYAKHIEKDAAFERRFAVVIVDEPSPGETAEILRRVIDRYEEHHGVRFDAEAIEEAVRLAVRYLRQRRLPDSALDVVDNAAADTRLFLAVTTEKLRKDDPADAVPLLDAVRERFAGEAEVDGMLAALPAEPAAADLEKLAGSLAAWKPVVTANGPAAYVSRRTGVPVSRVAEGEADKLLRMEELLGRFVIGQDEAVKVLSQAIRRSRAGFGDPKRPIGSFLFFGPTGVGKTYLAKMLARFLFDDENAIVRIDMSELKSEREVSRLIGAAPGTVGYEEGGRLTEPIRKKPYSVVLFDEIEKADRGIYDILLQVLDEGRLEDNQRRVADFTNTVIIMTSNVGAQDILAAGREDKRLEPEEMRTIAQRVFTPEQMNRIDELVPFYPYSKEEIFGIIDLELKKFVERLELKGLGLEVTDGAKGLLYETGHSAEFGIRPLRSEIKRLIVDQVADISIRRNPPSGTTFVCDAADGAMQVTTRS